MKFIILLLIVISSSVSADCVVQGIEKSSAKLFCVNTSKTEFLENSIGEKFKVITYDNFPTVEIYTQGENISIGETLKNSNSYKQRTTSVNQNQLAPIEIPIDTAPKQTILEKFNPFKTESLKIYATALQLAGSAMQAKFDEDTTKIESKTGEFNSLPLDLMIELDFGNSGLILSPDFQDKTGAVSVYGKMENLDIGGYFKVNNVSEDIKVFDSATTYLDEEDDSKTYGVGILVRRRSIFDSGEFHFTLTLGYQYSSTETHNRVSGATSEYYFNAATLRTEFSYYKKISQEFFVGAGLLIGTGIGHIEYNSGSNVLADRVTFANVEVNFLKVMMVF